MDCVQLVYPVKPSAVHFMPTPVLLGLTIRETDSVTWIAKKGTDVQFSPHKSTIMARETASHNGTSKPVPSVA